MCEAGGQVLPEAHYQRGKTHFFQNNLLVTPKTQICGMVRMMRAIHPREAGSQQNEWLGTLFEQLKMMELKEAKIKVREGIKETSTHMDSPS